MLAGHMASWRMTDFLEQFAEAQTRPDFVLVEGRVHLASAPPTSLCGMEYDSKARKRPKPTDICRQCAECWMRAAR